MSKKKIIILAILSVIFIFIGICIIGEKTIIEVNNIDRILLYEE
jgi:hypothetical protein